MPLSKNTFRNLDNIGEMIFEPALIIRIGMSLDLPLSRSPIISLTSSEVQSRKDDSPGQHHGYRRPIWARPNLNF